MVEYLQPILIALAVLLVPVTGRAVIRVIGKKLDEGRILAAENRTEISKMLREFKEAVMQELGALRKEVFQLSDRVSIIEADSVSHGRKIAFFEGVQSERAATAQAAIVAAALVTHPTTPPLTDDE